ncbi:hypothetical protein B0I35DRAFT_412060 [Stachybotrys elegans]|uniref:MARVEL domain-containing protein n=1 Tax=Stachybotrys elegans TaxID=80388 RepID=A0A8K0WMH8_9HYPO|nr:hypothetical protein B0I35DRAFT_412060 [Stachybotrys elegans]
MSEPTAATPSQQEKGQQPAAAQPMVPPGAPFQYGQYMYQPQVIHNKAWQRTKDALQIISLLASIIGLGLAGSLGGSWYSYYTLFWNLPLFIFTAIWSIAELAVRIKRKFQGTGIHPGVHVAMSLLIWLGASVIAGFQITLTAYRAYDIDYYDECWDEFEGEYRSCGTSSFSLMAALCAFTVIVWLVHFILFIGACVDTSKHNALRRAQVMFVQGPPPTWGVPPNAWQPVPMQPMPMPAQPQPTQAPAAQPAEYYTPQR